MSHELVMAIEHAHRVLDWQDNMTSEEIPPSWMWPFEDELKCWFEEVERQRKERYGGNDRDSDESVPMTSNELSKGRRG